MMIISIPIIFNTSFRAKSPEDRLKNPSATKFVYLGSEASVSVSASAMGRDGKGRVTRVQHLNEKEIMFHCVDPKNKSFTIQVQ